MFLNRLLTVDQKSRKIMMPQKVKMLAVEDDPEIRELLGSIFARAGLQAKVVGSLHEFRTTLADYDANICLVDIGLPDGDGLSLVAELQASGRRGVIILTGRGSEVDQVLGLEMGADDYILKPFRQRELIARVNAVARRLSGTANSSTIQQNSVNSISYVHGYEVDLATRAVTGPDGESVNLTTAEFDVFRVLIDHRGQCISRDEIISSVKGATWHASRRAVDGLISRLRKKLPLNPTEKELIKTLHGIGYMLLPESA